MNESDRRHLPSGTELTAHDPNYRENPYAALKELRERAPVFRDEERGRWLVTRSTDVYRLLRDKEMLADVRNARPESYRARMSISGQSQGTVGAAAMLFRDGDDHWRVRNLVNRCFTVKAAEQARPRIREHIRALLCNIAATEFDLIEAYAEPLPTTVIAEILGVEPSDRAMFSRWCDVTVVSFFDPLRTGEQTQQAISARSELNAYFAEMIGRRKERPGDDLISVLLQAGEDGSHLADLQVITECHLFLMAGIVTTRDLIGNGVKALLEHPAQLSKLRGNPQLIQHAVEEILRYDAPVTEVSRTVRRELSVGGCELKPGETATLSLAAANRDPSDNLQPDCFDVERGNVRHQSFGGGRHACPGASLARVEAQEAIMGLLTRFPELRAGSRGHRYRESTPFRGLAEYWVAV